jgi:hypothetical protein
MRIDILDEFIGELSKQTKKLKSFLKYREPEERVIVLFAFGQLADQYLMMSEEFLKQGKTMEATYFSSKAATIRQYAADVFGEAPEKDYYTGLYKISKDLMLETPAEELMQIAQFCVSNIEMPETKRAQDIKKEIEQVLRNQHIFGIFGKFSEVLLSAAKKQESPDKLSTILECALLLLNIHQTITALRQLNKNKKEEKKALGKTLNKKDKNLQAFKIKN